MLPHDDSPRFIAESLEPTEIIQFRIAVIEDNEREEPDFEAWLDEQLHDLEETHRDFWTRRSLLLTLLSKVQNHR